MEFRPHPVFFRTLFSSCLSRIVLVFKTKHILLPLFERKFPSKKGHIFQNSKSLFTVQGISGCYWYYSISIVTFYFLELLLLALGSTEGDYPLAFRRLPSRFRSWWQPQPTENKWRNCFPQSGPQRLDQWSLELMFYLELLFSMIRLWNRMF